MLNLLRGHRKPEIHFHATKSLLGFTTVAVTVKSIRLQYITLAIGCVFMTQQRSMLMLASHAVAGPITNFSFCSHLLSYVCVSSYVR